MTHRLGLAVLCWTLLNACGGMAAVRGGDGSPRHVPIDPLSIPEPQVRQEPRSRYGNPKSYVVFGKRYEVLDSAKGYRERGLASWYGTKFHGRRTSSGEPYDMFAISAAHKTLPIPSYVRVRNLENGRSLIVRVNDRGPFHPGRIIDLSYTAAVQLGVYAAGSAQVEVTAIDPPTGPQDVASTQAPLSDELDGLIARLQQSSAPIETSTAPELPYLELGSFTRLKDCEQLKSTLGQHNLLALQVQSADDSGPCRVIQGPFATRKDAEVQAQTLRELGYKPAVSYP